MSQRRTTSSSSLDAITAGFAASIALANGAAPKLGLVDGGTVMRSDQSYLIGRPLPRKSIDFAEFDHVMHHKWRTAKGFQMRERPGNVVLFSFPDGNDRYKVFQGGFWSFNYAPIAQDEYDGVSPISKIPLSTFRVWVKVFDIPPDFENPNNFALFGNYLGDYVDYDIIAWSRKEVIILITHDITKPILFEKPIWFAEGVEPVLSLVIHQLRFWLTKFS